MAYRASCEPYCQQDPRRVRRRGIWPPAGIVPTDEDVRQLANAGKKGLAVKIYKKLHKTKLSDAKNAVRKFSDNSRYESSSPRTTRQHR